MDNEVLRAGQIKFIWDVEQGIQRSFIPLYLLAGQSSILRESEHLPSLGTCGQTWISS